jgi:hypothetical protein
MVWHGQVCGLLLGFVLLSAPLSLFLCRWQPQDYAGAVVQIWQQFSMDPVIESVFSKDVLMELNRFAPAASVSDTLQDPNQTITFGSMKEVMSQVDPMAHILESYPGTYDKCHAEGHGVFWLYLLGHVRSFGTHHNNLKSFLQGSHRCWFIVMYTRDAITTPYDGNKWWVANTDQELARLKESGETVRHIIRNTGAKIHPSGTLSNLAYTIVKREALSFEQYRAVTSLGKTVAALHNIPQKGTDIVAISRPDIVFTNSINVPRIASVMARTLHLLMPHHAKEVGGNDPSEMLLVGPRKFWEDSCLFADNHTHVSPWVVVREPKSSGPASCRLHQDGCGYFGRHLIYAAYHMGVMPFFYFQPISLALHRISGELFNNFMAGMTRPLSVANRPVRSTVDLTQKVKCVIGKTTACSANEELRLAPQSPCWGNTTWVRINPSGGLWLCSKYSDVDRCLVQAD